VVLRPLYIYKERCREGKRRRVGGGNKNKELVTKLVTELMTNLITELMGR